MSCKSLAHLLRRCVAVRQLTLPAATQARGSGLFSGWLVQHRPRTSWTLQAAVTSSQHRFLCSKGASCEDEYPPLPAYETHSESKDVYLVQLKGLPWSCTCENILQFFSDCRINGGEKGIHLELDRHGRASGRAFIELEHEEDVCKALEKHRHYLGPRYIEVYEVTNTDAEAVLKEVIQKQANPPPADDGVVRIRGLPYSCTKEDIADFFSGLNIAENGITIVTDFKGRNSGNAFVQFASQEDADKALLKDRENMGNRYIEVFPSRRDDIHSTWKRKMSPDPSQSGFVSSPQAGHRNVLPQRLSMNHYVHMRGLPYQVTADEIVMFFSPLSLSKIVFNFNNHGRLNGEADVYFHSNQDAIAAMSRDKMNIGQRYIELFLNSPRDSDER
ncbi:G-rich sequence factor 1 isoform X3 [Mugil cephalus]|uniref:G-rich sequence factor 1 isoform X3 n=1 Tax=Mugil cephalus TaxID=48193 RepID=UPI001FB7C230|nr:G-rich sequence factor 1 isoform X3 [Mugil cephalus]